MAERPRAPTEAPPRERRLDPWLRRLPPRPAAGALDSQAALRTTAANPRSRRLLERVAPPPPRAGPGRREAGAASSGSILAGGGEAGLATFMDTLEQRLVGTVDQSLA